MPRHYRMRPHMAREFVRRTTFTSTRRIARLQRSTRSPFRRGRRMRASGTTGPRKIPGCCIARSAPGSSAQRVRHRTHCFGLRLWTRLLRRLRPCALRPDRALACSGVRPAQPADRHRRRADARRLGSRCSCARRLRYEPGRDSQRTLCEAPCPFRISPTDSLRSEPPRQPAD